MCKDPKNSMTFSKDVYVLAFSNHSLWCIILYINIIYTSTKVKRHPVFFSKLFSFSFFKKTRNSTRNAFLGNISLLVRSRATNSIVVEADYEIKLLVITSGKNGNNTDILKRFYLFFVFHQCRKTDEDFWMNVWRSLIAHINSKASITTTFTTKLPHSTIHYTN